MTGLYFAPPSRHLSNNFEPARSAVYFINQDGGRREGKTGMHVRILFESLVPSIKKLNCQPLYIGRKVNEENQG